MSIFDFLSGQFIDVIAWTDDTRDTMVWRFDRQGHEIKYGAKLTVREGQAAVFVHEGQLADVFSPGLYMLETNNMPIMTSLQHWDHGFQSPFKSEIYFINTTRFTDQKWGTKNPIMLRDPEFGPLRLRAFGSYAIKVSDPAVFMREIVGTDGEFTSAEVSSQIRNVIVQEFSRALAASGIPALDMAANTKELGDLVAKAIDPVMTSYGLTIPELYVENISLPDAVEKALDDRTSRGMAGNLDEHMKYKAAEAMAQPGSAAGQAMGLGMGAGLGGSLGMQMGHMAQAGPWGQTGGPAAPQAAHPAAAPPPPPPPPATDQLWHIAKAGEVTGPFSRAAMGRMVTDGSLARDSMVWTDGQDGWKTAMDTALAQLFTVTPPPPPPA
ncbi:Membrane protease subunit, stomatin/prohibitin family, contains C-terminal Zn-ribbon domain [Loktanella fryxellensis]|uniref:Membrane protease subunit, stomatin/prohibitin family, contains C-terminal Zn-ribbon domain n=1 Tax=Loktanella fryxellensis TaxID=245187 RepID=A0A1H8ABY4_9RHOB|nr:SPFH domain-containing protein [Loktanella fryxellensis]SEM67986.1 Membrane protease subunit, stomatin/prohibitin family, contains C-terminal Zn-ribbon domain [Loktanella fryxellensis]